MLIEENFKKNNITCAIATSDNKITIGFTNGVYSRPKTLLKGNELKTNPINIHLILSKKRNEKLFNTIIYGDKNTLKSFKNKIYHLLQIAFYKSNFKVILFILFILYKIHKLLSLAFLYNLN